MNTPKNAMEIFALLDKSNCKLCGEKTCLAFAGSVFLGRKHLDECPILDVESIPGLSKNALATEEDDLFLTYIDDLKAKVTKLDFAETSQRIGVQIESDELAIKVLGKRFCIAKDGSFATDLHVNPWLVVPMLNYILNCKGKQPTGDWVSFRELPEGKEKYALFKKRGEDVLKSIADTYTDFFNEIVHMFDGQSVTQQFESDISVVLYPFPLVPMMICYWKPDEDMDSSLYLYFDRSGGENLGVDSIFYLGTGIAQMFEKIAEHHGF